ncbi:tetratricopeptide repeat protein [Shewanella sp. LC6]|uniref:tetratricopeptide repeat protein n=1 Tax=unclassified Shewanella TaxID=196818 RepID=UPI001129A56A|nr:MULTISPECIES: tetratricopeptide repeat protein [unclassified Shewanella]QQK58584.1 tetratricopeptide repeat protein [Shewanella sp. LC6]TPE63551.1 tetratricopeptide repeat protein [Shewanella sp. LC2]
MSVINKMLQDLDKRQQGHSLSNVAVHQAQFLGRPNPSRKWLVISLVSLLVGGVSVYAFQAMYDSRNATDNSVNTVVSAQTPSDNTNPQTDTPAKDMSASVESAPSVALSPRVNASEPTTESVAANTSPDMPNRAALPQESVQAHTEPQQVAVKANQAEVNVNQSEVKITQTEAKASEAVESASTQASIQASSQAAAQPTGQMAVTEVKLSPSQLAQKQLVLASDAEKQGQLVKAMDYYAKALKLDPSLHESRKQLAALHYGQGEQPQAAEVLAQGRLLYPQEFEFALLLARVQHAMGDTDAALASLAQIPDSHPLARQKWLAQTDLAQKQGQYPLVEQAYRKLLQQEPQQGKWWMGLAYALDSQKQFTQASQAYRTALSYSGLSTQATAFIEQRLQQLGDSQ